MTPYIRRSFFMKDLLQLLIKHNIRFVDHANETLIFDKPNTALAAFAIDDAIATNVGNRLAPPTIRFWVHPNTVVLGIPDARLPHLQDGLEFLAKNNYHAVIRNSGGLAVLLNEGVLNMSLIIPNDDKVSIHNGYDMMLAMVQQLFTPYTKEIEAYEIVGSYCPGDYDLSMHGKKFAGISQRRVRNGIAVQIYLDIEGSSKERAAIVRDFYRLSKQDEVTNYTYPDVNPAVMASINELLGTSFTVQAIMDKIEALFIQDGITIASSELRREEREVFIKRYEQMQKRNEKIQSFNPS